MRRLTQRQKDILKLACYSNKEIAQRLILTPYTIRTTLHNASVRLRASSRTDALIKALKLNIINLDEVITD